MDYEKKYKEALERAREWYNKTEPDSYTCIVESIFPELKESEDEKIRKELITHCRNIRCVTEEGAEGIAKWITWLEKQGEKPQGKSALEAIHEQKVDNANKVEREFKVGDWIVNQHGTVRHIEEVGNVGYQTDGGWFTHDCYEKDFHLWSIADAKDGDILASDGCIFIFKSIHDNWISCYCSYHHDGSFIAESYDLMHIRYGKETYPATQKQRDLLFQKMKENGYEWNDKKKKPIKSEAICMYSTENYTDKERETLCEGCKVSCKYNHNTWSEEDENILKNLTDYFMVDDCLQFKEGKIVKWHESLKDRVEPKNRWKPSNEQIKALRWVLNNIPYNKHKEEISGLLDQIKDL